jgi:hypothetical protein
VRRKKNLSKEVIIVRSKKRKKMRRWSLNGKSSLLISLAKEAEVVPGVRAVMDPEEAPVGHSLIILIAVEPLAVIDSWDKKEKSIDLIVEIEE